MNQTVLVINALTLISLLVAFKKNHKKTFKSLKAAFLSFFNILPMVLVVVIIVGLILGFISQEKFAMLFGKQSGFLGIITVGGIGAILHIPSLIAFPLADSLLENGASIQAAAAFITTLTMVGTVYIPMEVKTLGKKFTLLRNGLSFVIAIVIAILMGVSL